DSCRCCFLPPVGRETMRLITAQGDEAGMKEDSTSAAEDSVAVKPKRTYDLLTAAEVVRQLPKLPTDALLRVHDHEISHRGRSTVLSAIDKLLAERGEGTEKVVSVATAHCTACDAVVGSDVNFCPNCGTALARAEPVRIEDAE